MAFFSSPLFVPLLRPGFRPGSARARAGDQAPFVVGAHLALVEELIGAAIGRIRRTLR